MKTAGVALLKSFRYVVASGQIKLLCPAGIYRVIYEPMDEVVLALSREALEDLRDRIDEALAQAEVPSTPLPSTVMKLEYEGQQG
jgi:hypothetical protein